jgi:TPR repeat protein
LSAEQGYADAQYFVAVCYYYGYGVASDVEVSNQWMQLAAQNGNEDAINYLNSLNKTAE